MRVGDLEVGEEEEAVLDFDRPLLSMDLTSCSLLASTSPSILAVLVVLAVLAVLTLASELAYDGRLASPRAKALRLNSLWASLTAKSLFSAACSASGRPASAGSCTVVAL